METLFQILYFVFGIFLIFYGIKTFRNSEKIYLERKNKKYRTAYEKWANEKNTPISIILILYKLFYRWFRFLRKDKDYGQNNFIICEICGKFKTKLTTN